MSVVILGAGGKVGRLLRRRWPGKATWLTHRDLDILDTAKLTDALDQATTVLCLAGVTHTSPRAMSLNAILAEETLDAAAAAHAGRVFLFSSAAVYGAQSGPLTEAGPVAPQSEYALAKRDMEKAAGSHSHPNTVLRLGNIAGADAILANWRPGFQLDTFRDGSTPRRSYIGPSGLARVLHTLCTLPDLPPLLNVSAPGAVEMGALLQAAGFDWTPRRARADTIADVILETSVLEQLTSFSAADSTPQAIVADWQESESRL